MTKELEVVEPERVSNVFFKVVREIGEFRVVVDGMHVRNFYYKSLHTFPFIIMRQSH